ncbi:MAG: hypothetical protein M0P14_00570 [Alkaliphilus sp.]|nr:hypothetical protein [Alkaliphilus sp.]
MFKRRRRHSSLKLIGSIITLIGVVMFLYIIPLQIWFLIIAGLFIMIGLLLCKIDC